MAESERAAAFANDDGHLRIAPPLLAVRLVGGVPGGRGVTLLTVAHFGRPDEPGTVLSLDTVSPQGAVRIAGRLVTDRLFASPLPSYEDALSQLTPSGTTPPSESHP